MNSGLKKTNFNAVCVREECFFEKIRSSLKAVIIKKKHSFSIVYLFVILLERYKVVLWVIKCEN